MAFITNFVKESLAHRRLLMFSVYYIPVHISIHLSMTMQCAIGLIVGGAL